MKNVVEVSRKHSLPVEIAKAKANDVATRMQSSLGIRWQWSSDNTITFDCPAGVGKGCYGSLETAANMVKVTINLPFMLALMHAKIEAEVNAELDASGIRS